MENSYEELVDADIRDEVAAMSHEEITAELERMNQEEEAVTLRQNSMEVDSVMKELTANPEVALTNTERSTLDGLVKSGADGNKAMAWIVTLRGSGIDSADFNPREAVEGQYLRPDAVYQEQAAKRLKDSFVNSAIADDLPIDLIKEMNHCQTKQQASEVLRGYREELITTAKDKANRYLLEQSQSFDLPMRLRSKISGVSARNLEEAKAKVDKLIKNYKEVQ